MFGGLLASGIANMDGVGGNSNWRWVFILEGLATILIGVAAFFFVADFPENSKWLTENERQLAIDRVGKSKADPTQHIGPADIKLFFSDASNILGGIIYFSKLSRSRTKNLSWTKLTSVAVAIFVVISGVSYFVPTIISALGYSIVKTQLLAVPPFAAATALALIFAQASDRVGLRSPFIVACTCLTITGLAILITVRDDFATQYAAICLVTMGAFCAGPLVICWYVMNLQGHAARSIGTAWIISFGNIGGIVATFAFLATEAPFYAKGYTACLAASCVGLASSIVYGCFVLGYNHKLARSTLGGTGFRRSL